MSSIFLSHSHKDKSFVRKLAASIRNRGHFVWVDEAEILVGDSLISKLSDAIDQVDYVAVVLSKESVKSEWVKHEVDIAMNREIGEKRVIVLPLRIEEVELPDFLRGKLYIDFSEPDQYAKGVKQLMQRLGPGLPTPRRIMPEESQILNQNIENTKRLFKQLSKKTYTTNKLFKPPRSQDAFADIKAANKKHPEHTLINNAYAFSLGNQTITLDYLLWTIESVRIQGSHPIEILLTLEGKWECVLHMLEAYRDYAVIEE